MQVAVTNVVAEHVGPLIDAFTARDPGLEVAIDTVAGDSMAELLEHRRADIALGPPPSPERAATIAIGAVPALPAHRGRRPGPSAGGRAGHPAGRAGRRALAAGAAGAGSRRRAPGCSSRAPGIEPAEVVGYTSHAAAVAAAAAGDGVVLTLAHTVIEELRRRALTRIDVRGTPMLEMWHASTLGFGRALPAALALQRFATSPEATQAISTGRAGTASSRARPRPHVTLWSSVAAGLRSGGGRRLIRGARILRQLAAQDIRRRAGEENP